MHSFVLFFLSWGIALENNHNSRKNCYLNQEIDRFNMSVFSW